jgi:Lrp/AsnC ligand binding domain
MMLIISKQLRFASAACASPAVMRGHTRTACKSPGRSPSPGLREDGYIKATVAVADRQELGFMMQIFEQVKMSRLTDGARAELIRQINGIPEIPECYTVFGEMEVMMKVVATDVLSSIAIPLEARKFRCP